MPEGLRAAVWVGILHQPAPPRTFPPPDLLFKLALFLSITTSHAPDLFVPTAGVRTATNTEEPLTCVRNLTTSRRKDLLQKQLDSLPAPPFKQPIV